MNLDLLDRLKTRCNHLGLQGNQGSRGDLCLIAIGNLMHEVDSLALYAACSVVEKAELDYCFIGLETHINKISQLVGNHKVSLIVDTVANLESSNYCVYKLDSEFLLSNPRELSTSHGLSWIDELNSLELSSYQVYFFGVSSALNGQIKSPQFQALENKLGKLVKVLKEGRLPE